MIKSKLRSVSTTVSEVVIHGIQEKKGNDIVRLDLRNLHSSVSDFFVICHADSNTQVRAIANSVEDEILKAFGYEAWRKEGFEHGEWILLDYVDVVVHIFKTEKRQFYGIEELWGDAEIKSFKSA